jgi:pre-mRNA-splicing helicase BRR2
VPAIRHLPKSDEVLIPISKLPLWTHAAFPPGMNSLNLIQSKLYDKAFNSPENILVCAPTGAGKTNIAMLTIL